MGRKPHIGALASFSVEPSERYLPPLICVASECSISDAETGRITHPAYAEAAERCGIDPDERGIEFGRKAFPGLNLMMGVAESLSFGDAQFDVVTARVSLLYSNIPVVLSEITRVMKPGGYLCLGLHDWRRHWLMMRRIRTIKPAIDFVYVTLASWCYALTDWIPPRPWSPTTRETYQIFPKMHHALAKLGFREITFIKTPEAARSFVTAIRGGD